MARTEYKELSDNTGVRWSTKDEEYPFEVVKGMSESDPPAVVKLTPEEARELILFLTRWLYEYIQE